MSPGREKMSPMPRKVKNYHSVGNARWAVTIEAFARRRIREGASRAGPGLEKKCGADVAPAQLLLLSSLSSWRAWFEKWRRGAWG